MKRALEPPLQMHGVVITQKRKVILAHGKRKGPLYDIEAKPLNPSGENSLLAFLQLWHERLAHVASNRATGMLDGLGDVHRWAFTLGDDIFTERKL